MDKNFEQFERFMKMSNIFCSDLAGYLLMKVETATLTEEDILLAQSSDNANCTLVNVLAGNLEEIPDLVNLRREALKAIAFDLDIDVDTYLEKMGFDMKPIKWEEDDDDELDDDTIERLR